MNSTTIVVHSSEAASDVHKWLKKKKVKEHYDGEEMEVDLENETVLIFKKDNLIDNEICNKLVLLGSFNIEDLIWIIKVITIHPTPGEQQAKLNRLIGQQYF